MNPLDHMRTILDLPLWSNVKNYIFANTHLVQYTPLFIELICLIWYGGLILRFWVLVNTIYTLLSMRYRLILTDKMDTSCVDLLENDQSKLLTTFGKIIICFGSIMILFNMMYIDVINVCNSLIILYLILRTHRNMYRI